MNSVLRNKVFLIIFAFFIAFSLCLNNVYAADAFTDCKLLPIGTLATGEEEIYTVGQTVWELDAGSVKLKTAAGKILNSGRGQGKTDITCEWQWYSNTSKEYDGASKIEGATNAKYTPANDTAGTKYYYVTVKVTYGGQSTDLKSSIATITMLPAFNPELGYSNGYVKKVNVEGWADFKQETTAYTVKTYSGGIVFNLDLNIPDGKKLYYQVRDSNGFPICDLNGLPIVNTPVETAQLRHVEYRGFTYSQDLDRILVVGTVKDVDGNGIIDYKDSMDVYDAYKFTVCRYPAINYNSLSVYDENGTQLGPMNGWFTESIMDYYVAPVGDKLQIKQGTSGVQCHIDETELKKNKLTTISLSDYEKYKDEQGFYNLPIKVTANGTDRSVTYNLHVAPSKYAPVITKQPENVSMAKGDSVTVSIEAKAEEGEISYRWPPINGQEFGNEAEISINAAEKAGTDEFCKCLVVNTVDGHEYYILSNSFNVTTELTYINDINVVRELGTFTYDKKLGVLEGAYKTDYHAGEKFNDIWLELECKENGKGKQYTEEGTTLSFDFYYNDTPSTEGGTPISVYKTTGGYNSATLTLPFRAAEGLPAGTHYVYCVITATSDDNPNVYKTRVTGPVKMEYAKPELDDLNGAGTEDDPYLLTKGEDFAKIKELVNEQGYTMNDTYFKMANDITLPADWTSIGTTYTDNNQNVYVPFCGHLDGGGYTLFYPDGVPALFLYANGATVKNLNLDCVNGGTINGSALLSGYYIVYRTTAITVQDVTMLENFKSTGSGLVDGTATMSNYVFIYGCKAKAGAQIGAANQENVGTFVGHLNGKVIGCESWATVTGREGVGGIVGSFSNSVGKAYVYNNSFHGTVNASGKYAGGILGLGFDNKTAPNAMQPRIVNCYVDGTVIGERRVGGIYGGTGVEQAWSNGPLYLQNNLFVGTVKATATDYEAGVAYGQETKDWIPGAIVGYMNGLNKNDIIENNHFKAQTLEDGSDLQGIGGVGTVDTSAVPSDVEVPTKEFTGEGDDTPQNYYKDWKDKTFYFNTSVDDVYGIKNFVDREDFGTPDWSNVLYVSVTARNLNRDDDPLGKDKEKLARPATAEELANGTVQTMLNSSDTSYKNWVAGANGYPVHNEDAIAIELEVSGNYKTDYIIGEQLNTTGMVFTATMSDGTTRNIPVSDINITGFNSNSRAELTLTAAYGAVTCDIKVSILYPSNAGGGGSDDITVYFTLLGDTVHGDPTEKNTHTLKDNNLITWIAKTPITIDHNATVWDLLQEVTKQYPNAIFNKEKDNYVATVTWKGKTIGELDNGELSGWMYTLNGHHPLLGVEEQTLKNKDVIVWHYTDDYTVEEGSEEFNNGGGGEVVESKYTAADVKDLINKIGKVTKDSKKAIEEARKAYDSLTAAQQKNVTNYDKLVAAEKAYTELTGEKIESGSLPFADVAKDSWYYDAIKAMYDKGLMNGEDNNKFNPSNKLSRAMLVTILYRMQNEPSVVVGSDFNDIKDGLWYTKAVAWASVNNVVNGVGEGRFAPNDSITRQELAVMLYRYAKAVGMDTASMAKLDSFKDNAQVADWASEAMQWAVGSGLMKGNDDGTINPNGTATRAEVATVVVRLIEKTVK